jgi:glycosyltransferase involved in cell wall biosynthesis
MKLSIITINLNNAAGLNKTISSVINQTQKIDVEYIVIDGHSNDDSLEIIKSYSESINYWVSEADTGIYNAMNKGVTVATGDYLLFLNSGDTLCRDTILEHIFPMLQDFELIYGNLVILQNNEEIQKKYPDNLSLFYFCLESLPHPATFIKKTLFDSVGLYNEEFRIASDWEFFIKALFIHHCSYLHINDTITTFPYDGISSIPESKNIADREKRIVLDTYFKNYLYDWDKMQRDGCLIKYELETRIARKGIFHCFRTFFQLAKQYKRGN